MTTRRELLGALATSSIAGCSSNQETPTQTLPERDVTNPWTVSIDGVPCAHWFVNGGMIDEMGGNVEGDRFLVTVLEVKNNCVGNACGAAVIRPWERYRATFIPPNDESSTFRPLRGAEAIQSIPPVMDVLNLVSQEEERRSVVFAIPKELRIEGTQAYFITKGDESIARFCGPEDCP